MTNNTSFIARAAITTAGIAAVLLSSAASVSAGPWNESNGWRGKKVVVHHYGKQDWKQTRVRKVVHRYRPARTRVVHVHHYRPDPRPRVTVVHHNHRHDSRPAFGITNETGGTILGGLIGAITGSRFGKGSGQVAAVIGGTVIGAVIGGQIGQSMDRNDHAHVQSTFETARTGQAAEWQNPDSGLKYTVTPTRTFTANSRPCRDYEAWAFVDGYEEKITGTACRQADGSWKTVTGGSTVADNRWRG